MGAVYGSDLAFIHQTGFNTVAVAAAGEVIAALRKNGCKSARDQSPAFVKLAKKTAPRAKIRPGSIHDAAIPECEAVTAIGEVLNYVGGSRTKGRALTPLFKRIARALPRGGLFLFDVILPGGKPALGGRGWRGGEDWAVMTEASEDKKGRRIIRDITTFRETKRGWRRSRERHVQYLYTREEIMAALADAGFSVKVQRRYGPLDMLPRRLAFRAVRKT